MYADWKWARLGIRELVVLVEVMPLQQTALWYNVIVSCIDACLLMRLQARGWQPWIIYHAGSHSQLAFPTLQYITSISPQPGEIHEETSLASSGRIQYSTTSTECTLTNTGPSQAFFLSRSIHIRNCSKEPLCQDYQIHWRYKYLFVRRSWSWYLPVLGSVHYEGQWS